MEKFQNKVFWAIALSETSHIFCCVMPTIFSLVSLMAGLGLVGALPAGYVEFHDLMHDWELPMIAVSGFLLALGWGLYAYSKKVDCHDTGCSHGPCTPKKNKSRFILILASTLFVVNLGIYSLVHQDVLGLFAETYSGDAEHSHTHGAH